MKYVEFVEIKITALPDTNIGNCMQEGIILAATEWRNVCLRHNGKDYDIHPNELIASVTERKTD